MQSPRPHFKAKGIPNDKGMKDEIENKEVDVEEDSEEIQFAKLNSVLIPL